LALALVIVAFLDTIVALLTSLVRDCNIYLFHFPGERDNARNNVRCTQAMPRTAWMDNIKTWTGLPVEESIRMTEDRDKWRKYVDGVANTGIEDG